MIHHVTLLAGAGSSGSCSTICGCEIRPDDRRSGHADGAPEPSVCGGSSGADRRIGGDDGREPRSGGDDGLEPRSGGDDGLEPR
jgi:hypothetical protein